jgi:hypothetical protein
VRFLRYATMYVVYPFVSRFLHINSLQRRAPKAFQVDLRWVARHLDAVQLATGVGVAVLERGQ